MPCLAPGFRQQDRRLITPGRPHRQDPADAGEERKDPKILRPVEASEDWGDRHRNRLGDGGAADQGEHVAGELGFGEGRREVSHVFLNINTPNDIRFERMRHIL